MQNTKQQTSKPLSQLIDEVTTTLEERGYSKSSLRHYGCIYSVFKKFSTIGTYTDEEGAKFLLGHYGVEIVESATPEKLTPHMQTAFRAMMILSDYYHGRAFTQRRYRKAPLLTWPEAPLQEFEEFLQTSKFCDWSYGYRRMCIREFMRFATYLHEQSIKTVTEITPAFLTLYLSTALTGYSSSMHSIAFAIFRAFFRFLYISEYHPLDLSESVPSVHRTPPGLPFAWADGSIEKLLSCLDRGNPTEARDYAIILLISKSGLRISDVRNLRLKDIIWEQNRIELIQQKTKEPLVLPLLKDVGEAIVDYLKYYRPPSKSDYVFVSHTVPFGHLGETNDLTNRLDKYIARAEIKIPPNRMRGPHSLRHALAVKLLDNNVSLLTISGILGHGDINSAADYLRVDVELLRQCTLSPEVNCNV